MAHNARALGSKVWIAGVVGSDDEAKKLVSQMRSRGIETSAVLATRNRPTTVKTRVVAHHQQVVRIDRESVLALDGSHEKKIFELLERKKKSFDAILIEDYGKGVITQNLVTRLIDFAKEHSVLVAVDPKKGHFLDYRGADFATPNFEEALYFAGVNAHADDHSRLDEVGSILLDKWDARSVLVTLGAQGMRLFERGKRAYHIPTRAREVFDVSGAGDTVIATFAVSVLSGASFPEAALLANEAAGIVVGKLGTAVATPDEIKREIEHGA